MRNKYRLIILLAIAIPMLWGCPSKIVEQKKEDFVINLITSNIWIMNSFYEGSTNLTTDFASYEFKFNNDGTVYGIKVGAPNATGTWTADATSMTIQSNFPTETGILKKLNGTFTITSSSLSDVKANRFEGTTELKLHLIKK
jgi:hypothetical protein